jgi:pentatricopeptide repeat protein
VAVPLTSAAVQAAEKQLLKHLEQREFTRALNLYRSMERDGRDQQFSEELYSAFIQSAIRVGKIDVVERMLRSMNRSSVTPSLRFWQTTLKLLSSRKHFSACLSVFSVCGKVLPCDKIVFSCLINAALETGAPEVAATMLEKYAEAELDPKDHVLFFRTYVALNDVEKSEALFLKLGDKATSLMLNLLLLTCVNTNLPKRGLELLNQAHDFEKTAAERIVDVVSYNTVIKGFAQLNSPVQCFDCLCKMIAHGLDPDDITFGYLLDACFIENDMSAANELVNLLIGRGHKMDTVMCTLFIKGLVRVGCLPKALELYEEMKKREDSHPDIVTYSVLIKALVDQHQLDRALQLVDDMKNAGRKIDDIILTHLLEGCRHADKHDLGKTLFADSLAAGVTPSEFTLVTMLKLHGRCGAHKEAYELVATWQSKYGLTPSVIHYTCLISGCLRTKSYDQAWDAYKLMCANGIALDEMAVSTLLPGLVAAQRWDQVLQVVRQTIHHWQKQQTGSATTAEAAATSASPTGHKSVAPIAAEALNHALAQMLTAGRCWPEAESLLALMREAHVPVTARNAKRLSD